MCPAVSLSKFGQGCPTAGHTAPTTAYQEQNSAFWISSDITDTFPSSSFCLDLIFSRDWSWRALVANGMTPCATALE